MKLLHKFAPLALAGLIASGGEVNAQENTLNSPISNAVTPEEIAATPSECKVERLVNRPPLLNPPSLSNEELQEIGRSTYKEFQVILQNKNSYPDPEILNILAHSATGVYLELLQGIQEFPQNFCITHEEFYARENKALDSIERDTLKERRKEARDYILNTVMTDKVFSKNEALNYFFLSRASTINAPFHSVEELSDNIISKLEIERTNVNIFEMRVFITEKYIETLKERKPRRQVQANGTNFTENAL